MRPSPSRRRPGRWSPSPAPHQGAATLDGGAAGIGVGGVGEIDGAAAGTAVPVDQGDATVTTGSGNDTIVAGGYGNVINAGAGMNFITGGTGDDTFILDSPGFDTISNFSLTNGDVLNLAAALTAAGWSPSKTLANYLKVVDSSTYVTLSLVPGGTGPATAIAQLNNVGTITLSTLQSHLVL